MVKLCPNCRANVEGAPNREKAALCERLKYNNL